MLSAWATDVCGAKGGFFPGVGFTSRDSSPTTAASSAPGTLRLSIDKVQAAGKLATAVCLFPGHRHTLGVVALLWGVARSAISQNCDGSGRKALE